MAAVKVVMQFIGMAAVKVVMQFIRNSFITAREEMDDDDESMAHAVSGTPGEASCRQDES